MTALSGYEFATLREGEFTVCRGSSDGLPPVLLVTPVAEHPSPKALKRLEHEYALRAELDQGWAAMPLALTYHDNRLALVLEDPGGEPLDRLLIRPLETMQLLRIAISVAGALRHVHERNLIHKDIKPANILVDRTSGEAWLTGFGIASRLPREHQVPEPPEVIAGTLAYMAPEQTGRMNRSVDSRSDLYALGVTLYEMLTGALPFTVADPMAWVHCHVARQPVPPSERMPAVSAQISSIVMKLLAKTAEQRYQTAAGVVADLQRCLTEWEAQRRIDPFPLGAHDTSARLLIPERLYGREREIATLLASCNRVVADGISELVLVSGYSGIGKSFVVNELHRVLVQPRGLFASGKFDQYKRDIPYSTLAQAFQSLIGPLLGKSDPELAGWRDAFREALGPNARLIIDLVPELKLIVGDQPAVPELPPQDQQARFQLVFRRFLGVFARPEHPLALFIDDLQWLDSATLDLIEHLVVHPEVRHLLLIGAYRDNEVGPTHPLAGTLARLRGGGGRVQEIMLTPLMPDDVERLLGDALHTDRARVQPLANLVFEKSAGNPFFTIQFLSALAEEQLLTFDPDKAAWGWDLPRIRAKGFTDNVADLIAAKLSRLPPTTQKVLGQLACLGNAADSETLALVHEASDEATDAALWEAVRAGLVLRSGGTYAFLHDRVQEAAYTLIVEDERAMAHLRIGRLLAARTPPEHFEESIFDIVNQFDRGAALISTEREREQVATFNLTAGKRAKAATAYTAALRYFVVGRSLLGKNGWEQCYQLIFDLELNRGECEYLTGELAAAEERLSQLSMRAQTIVHAAAVACVRINLYTTVDRSNKAVEVGLDYLRRVDARWPQHATAQDVQQEYDRLLQRFGSGSIEGLLELPLMIDPDRRVTMDVLTVLTSPALFTDLNLFRLVVGRMASLSLEHGSTDGSSLAYAWLGAVLGTHFGDYQAGFRFGKLGLDLVEKRGLDRFRARVYLVFAVHVAHWTQPLATSRAFLRRAFDAAQEAGDLSYAAYSCIDLTANLLASGAPLDQVEREAEIGIKFARDVGFGLAENNLTVQFRLIRMLRGLTPDFGSFNDATFDESHFVQRLENNRELSICACWYWIRKLQGGVYVGDSVSAIAAAAKVSPLLWTAPTQVEQSEYQFYGALARAARCDKASAEERLQHLAALADHSKEIAAWAKNCPATFANRAALVAAEIARLEGRELDAERLYEEAIRSAREHNFVPNEGLANELAARFYVARGFKTIADAYLRNARHCYLRWGAEGKVRQLEELYPHLREWAPVPGPTSTIGAPIEHLDLATVLKVSQAVSGEIVLEKLIDTLLRMAVEHAGAERGLLILQLGAELRIQAEAATGGSSVTIDLGDAPISGAELPESVLRYAARTQESVILDDASARGSFSGDDYIVRKHARSVLCIPLVKQGKSVALLYLENNLAPHAFTPARVAVLELLAAQAAISLENARLYRDVREREARIRRLVDSNIIGIAIWDFQGRIVEANQAFLDMVGYTREDLVSSRLRWTELTPAEWRDADDRALAEMKATGTVQPREKEYFHKDGSRVPVLLGATTFADRQDEGVAFVLDITERKRLEECLRVQHTVGQILAEAATVEDVAPRILRAIGEGLGWDVGALWRVDREADALRCVELWHNASIEVPEFERISRELTFVPGLGLPGRVWSSLEPEYIPDVVVPDGNFPRGPIAQRDLWPGGRATQDMRLVKRLRAAFGFPILLGREALGVIEFFSREIRQPDQELLNMVATIGSQIGQFIERKRAEEAFRKAQMQLAHANRVAAMGQLSASIAHEVKQPITAAVTYALAARRWLGAEPPNFREADDALSLIVKEGNRAGEVVARIPAHIKNVPARKDAVAINDAILEVIALTRTDAANNSVSVRTQLAEGLLPVQGDRVQLQQVVLNLIINAIEAMRDVREEERELFINTRNEPDGVSVEVRDSGPGFAPETLEHVFALRDGWGTLLTARRVPSTTKPGGLGLGLSICRSIIEAHGGRLWASANLPRGASFQFALPAIANTAS
ncbi:ATP-binding sensor histidine kinase [Bradyrhizobium erythrophlei]|uniref:histidine kinase n=1 Tax=Bradyrhizobium erythrophlei TaxID=1437360 RepID=A0A1H4YU81_9BRAD|nr:AAA family ATPase [Bradyrhizobium erythrophlei]SED21532.1 PAS domain S-box-containing protein [Bradyrhizobium erythrophlei]